MSPKKSNVSQIPLTHTVISPPILRRSSPSHYYFTVLLLFLKVKVRGYLPPSSFYSIRKRRKKGVRRRDIGYFAYCVVYFFLFFGLYKGIWD